MKISCGKCKHVNFRVSLETAYFNNLKRSIFVVIDCMKCGHASTLVITEKIARQIAKYILKYKDNKNIKVSNSILNLGLIIGAMKDFFKYKSRKPKAIKRSFLSKLWGA